MDSGLKYAFLIIAICALGLTIVFYLISSILPQNSHITRFDESKFILVEDKFSELIYWGTIMGIFLVILSIIISLCLFRYEHEKELRNSLKTIKLEVDPFKEKFFISSTDPNFQKEKMCKKVFDPKIQQTRDVCIFQAIIYTPAYESIINSGNVAKMDRKLQTTLYDLYGYIKVRNDYFLYLQRYEDLSILTNPSKDSNPSFEHRLAVYYLYIEGLESKISDKIKEFEKII